MGRRRRKDQPETDDRDKTLEPDKSNSFSNPLSRSATTVLSSAGKKERTPYRLHRNYSDRKPTGLSSGASSSAYNSSRTRPELSVLHRDNGPSSSSALSKPSYYDPPSSRQKDSLYDLYGAYGSGKGTGSAYNSAYSSRLPANRYNDYDYLGAYGYYDGRDKENSYKSKYEPSRIYAELATNNNDASFGRDRDRDRAKRFQKTYRRTATAHDLRPSTSTNTNYRDLYGDEENALADTTSSYTSRYAPRKSSGYQRSQTQKFFDSEKSSVLRSLDDNNNDLTMDSYDDELKTEAMKQREARRKEIQGLIAKYAQIDDVYNRALDNKPTSSTTTNQNGDDDLSDIIAAAAISTKGLRDSKANDYDLLTGGNGIVGASAYGNIDPYGLTRPSAHASASFLPLAKTQSASAMSSMNRSRIPKQYSSFVRFFLIEFYDGCCRHKFVFCLF